MKRLPTALLTPCLTLLVLSAASLVNAQFAPNYTPTYAELIDAYRDIAERHENTTQLTEFGDTDAGLPLHVLVVDGRGAFTPEGTVENEQVVCLIINGIHAGEPAGINASVAFAEERAEEGAEDVVYVIVPVYNIGGVLNRNSHSRYNQDGPEAHGFRGNARNLDLNRDFIKCDSRNALSFTRLFHRWSPHVFIDTHTSNGADYQHTMTLLTGFPEKLVPMQQGFVEREMEPALYKGMEELGDPMIPYVQLSGTTPEEGLEAFTDHPRYGSGYAALFNTLSFVTEAHMLKPFDQRVQSTLRFLRVLDGFLKERGAVIRALKQTADDQTASAREFPSGWRLGAEVDSVMFAGYEAVFDTLDSGAPIHRYDRSRPYRKMVPFRSRHVSQSVVVLPEYYAVPGAWREMIERLEANGIEMITLESDTVMEATADFVSAFETVDPPYEGHYLHYNTRVVPRKVQMTFFRGDKLIPTQQVGNRYLAATLHPESPDSFFNWNFFDSVLRKKEYASPYLFADTAAEILRRDRMLREEFQAKVAEDPGFAKNTWLQMDYILNHSELAEREYMRIPVYRVE